MFNLAQTLPSHLGRVWGDAIEKVPRISFVTLLNGTEAVHVMVRRSFAAAAFLAVFVGALAFAAEQATFVLRNGERRSGTVVFHGSYGNNLIDNNMNLRIGENEQSFALDNVAVIEFASGMPPTSELQQIPASGNLLAFRNGGVEHGQFVNIVNGQTVQWRTSDGSVKNYPTGEVSRIYLSPDAGRIAYNYSGPTSAGGVATSGSQPSPATPGAPGTVTVSGNMPWTDTGITVRKGDRVSFHTGGQIQYAYGGGSPAGPDGNNAITNPSFPVAVMPVGGLIGKVGDSAPFPIGANTQPITMPAGGRLLLGINDTEFSDNGGWFSVVVTSQKR
jgi:hypothetical protein